MSITFIGIIVVSVILLVVVLKLRKRAKKLKLPNVYLITGGVKCGKSLLSVNLAIKQYKRNLLKWYLTLPFMKLKQFIQRKHKDGYKVPLKPVLYSNIPLRYVKYSKLTKDILLRKVKLPLNSVVFIDECSLVFDSLMIYSNKFNEILKNFFKLFAHANGNDAYCIMNTQAFSDLHFNCRRCCGSFLWIYSKAKFPFITILKVREMLNIDDVSINTSDSDFESSLLTMWLWNKTYKKYDSRCYSPLTDDLPLANIDNIYKGRKDSLKSDDLLSLQADYVYLLSLERKEKNKKYIDEKQIENGGTLL